MVGRSKGFTLIELLAVIVILAIIMTISVPQILKIIEDAKKVAFQNSVYGIVKAVELEYSKSMLTGKHPDENGEESSSTGQSLNYKGNRPQNGKIIINSEGKITLALHDGTYCAEKGFNDAEVIITKKELGECKLSE